MEELVAKHTARLKLLLAAPCAAFDSDKPDSFPMEGGVYRVLEKGAVSGKTLYVGKAKNLRRRILRNHLGNDASVSTLRRKLIKTGRGVDAASITAFLRTSCDIQLISIPEPLERTSFEHFAISLLSPDLND